MSGLRIGRGLTLPLEYVTKTGAIIAKRRVGKSYAGAVMAEEFCAAGIPWYALDPTGAWWGLRSSADGKKAGLPVIVLGGEHGDVPITEHDGKTIADLIVEEPAFYVVDLSDIDESHAATVRFVTAYLDRLYRRKARAREPLHGFWDEADMFAPQKPGPEQTRMLGAAESIVRRGGIRGLGTTLITQRAAVLNKNVLTQLDILFLLRTISPQDQDVVDDYVKRNSDASVRAEIMGSLASLEIGEVWAYGPGEEPALMLRVKVRARRTFNSSATPKVGEKRIEPTKLAEVDLDALRGRLAAQIEKAKADDPKLLRARIKELERDLAARPKPERVEVPVLSKVVSDQISARARALEELVEAIKIANEAQIASIHAAAESVTLALERWSAPHPARPAASAAGASPRRQGASIAPTPAAQTNGNLPKVERAILSVLFQHGPLTKRALAMLAGYSAKGGGYNNGLSSLRTKGYLEGRGDPVSATQEGMAAVEGQVEPLPTGRALFEHWLGQVGKAERAVLEVLAASYPVSLSKEEIAELAGYSPTGGGFNNALSRLRTLQLINGRGDMELDATLGNALLDG